MFLKELGRTGVRISEVGIGTSGYEGGPGPLRRGLERGALFIDTAESYEAEAVVGEAVRGIRDRVFIATKVSPEHFRPADVRHSVDASLLRLGVDTIDLLQLHHSNPAIPIHETMGAVGEMADAGKVRFCGVSNFSVDQLRDAQMALRRHPVVSNQVRFNLIDRTIEAGLLQYCQAEHITVIAYSPLAASLGRILDCDSSGTLAEITRATGKSPAQIAINWCLCRDGIVAIPKGGSQEHILENCGASDWRLSTEQIALLDARIQYRCRNWLAQFVRQSMPQPLRNIAANAVRSLPSGLRRRVLY
jgi:diketogulonate reductase-like aldo/keto reductase